MKIVHVVIGGEVAGGQAIALRLARAARDRGDEVAFVAPERGRFTEQADSEGFRVHLLALERSFQVGALFRLARLLRRERADVVHTHTLAAGNVLSRVAAYFAGVPVVSHLHIENFFRPSTRAVVARLDSWSAHLCARLLAVSEDTRAAYERQGYPRGRIEVVYNGVDLPLDGSQPHNDPPVVAEIARLCDVKGQRDLIRALADVPHARLLLAGRDLERGGEYLAALEREAERAGVRARVEFAGHRDDVPELLDRVDVVALPSWTEGLPMIVLEAMAHGRPVLATPVGGTPEAVVDGETGLLVPPRDPQALASALRRLLDDAELRARLGAAGRKRVEELFSAAEMEQRVLEIYDDTAG
jgi:glycosyltransferase involved in cell wall biosynthesis